MKLIKCWIFINLRRLIPRFNLVSSIYYSGLASVHHGKSTEMLSEQNTSQSGDSGQASYVDLPSDGQIVSQKNNVASDRILPVKSESNRDKVRSGILSSSPHTGSAPKFIHPPHNITVVEGEEATLMCGVSSMQGYKVSITWTYIIINFKYTFIRIFGWAGGRWKI